MECELMICIECELMECELMPLAGHLKSDPQPAMKITGGVLYHTWGKSGEILQKIVDHYSQQAKYGAVFGETINQWL